MNFSEAATFLFDLRRYSPRPGIESTRDLLSHLGDPHEGIEYVQVAGSNGKGSTARMTERVLREAGFDVGLYTSPHLDDVRERIRIDGRRIGKQAVGRFVGEIEEYVLERAADGHAPTFFEALTALALWEFGRQAVDVAVLEVGIGGRYDATSVVDPVASAVTSVTLEHTDFLGDTVEEIARDKAQVAPADAGLVTATTGEALDAVRTVADDVVTVDGADTDADVRVTYEGRDGLEAGVSLAGGDWAVETRLALLGAHQARNAGVAAALSRQVGVTSEEAIARGLRRAYWPGRFEVMSREPLVVLDGAHNPGACERVTETLAEFEFEDLHLVFGAMWDKDYEEMARLLPTPARVVTTRPPSERAEDDRALATAFRRVGVPRVESRKPVADALDVALEGAGPDDCVLVAGSLYTVAEARSRWTRRTTTKRVRNRREAREVLERADVADAAARRVQNAAVHRVIETRAGALAARALRETIRALGGTGAISAIENAERERRDVVLAGTDAQLSRLAATSERDPRIPTDVARDLRAILDDGTGSDGDRFDAGGATGAVGSSDVIDSGRSDASDADAAYPWTERTAVMGILNVTPDSFHDGGRYEAVEDAVRRAEEMVADGADVIDVGGESTRPGAEPVGVAAEIERIEPVIERIADLDALVSVDTRKAAVARAALEAGADVLNDVSGLEDPEMRFVAAEYGVPIIVMHSIDAPVVPGKEIDYDDVVTDAIDELAERVLLAERAGVPREEVVVDPGFGFGKSAAESFELLGRIEEFHALGCPVLAGHSHKSMFGLVGVESDDRLAATVAGSAIAAERGADIVRVHDVKESVAAVRVAAAADDPERFANGP